MIFAGRQQTMELLMPQLKSDYIDEILIAKNTKNINDLKYINTLKDKYDKITYIELPENKIGNFIGWQYLYNYLMDEDTVYIKLDDDIIYLSENFFENILKYRFEHPEYICVFPMVVNNSYTATLHKNSLLNIPNTYDEYKISEDANEIIYEKLMGISYTIANKYNLRSTNNNIKLQIDYKGMSLTSKTDFTFVKEGQPGTNGTEFVCKIVPNITSGNAPLYPTITYNEATKQSKLNYKTNANI